VKGYLWHGLKESIKRDIHFSNLKLTFDYFYIHKAKLYLLNWFLKAIQDFFNPQQTGNY
jgi:hypothetical protein